MVSKSGELQPKPSSGCEGLDLKSIRDDIACPDSDLKASVLAIFLSLLEGYQSIQDAVKEINTLYPTKQPWHDGTETYDTTDFFWALWRAMFSIVRILPYNHPKQELLVEFLVTLSREVMGTATVWGAEMRIWRDLPLLGPCLREEWGYSTLGEDIPTPEESSKWLGLNSFTARLHNESLVDATNLAMYELRTALEEEHPAREVANCKISVASEWIIKSGMKLYSEAPLHKDERWMNPTGPLYDGEAGISRERWQFWKLRFSEVQNKVDKDVAEMAVCAMEKAEKVMRKLKRDLDLSTADETHRPSKSPRVARDSPMSTSW
jgi:hypothetical protein